ncbi:MAG: P1 family peptidase [Alphaproteobacteria bacterium]|nr:P1 family peptidase [Alphaproteobacteria bacterium]
MIRPGARNLITDIEGLLVGNAHDASVRTGVTVLLGEAPLSAAVEVRGGAPGTRDTEALDLANLVGAVDAIVLSGGSVFGLDASAGVIGFLRKKGRGYALAPGAPRAPIVPAAILFDLGNGGDKDWGEEAPYRRLGFEAAASASAEFRLGNQGAGLGARAATMKGGLGSASSTDGSLTVGAIAAVNSLGSPLVPGTGVFWASPYELEQEFGGRRLDADFAPASDLPADMRGGQPRTATTISIVATDADASRAELKRIAIMACDGLARALRPAHTPFDGDIVFAVATARRPLPTERNREVMRIGSIAADTLARAIARGVYEAETLGDAVCYRETFR